MPSSDPHSQYNRLLEEPDDDFSVFAPAAINTSDYDDTEAVGPNSPEARAHRHYLPQSVNQRRHRERSYVFSCLDNQSVSSDGSDPGQIHQTPRTRTVCVKGKRILGHVLANVFVSIGLILLTLGLSFGSGCYAYFGLSEKPYIDKSVNSFQIPNHNATRMYDAFNGARKEIRTLREQSRPKRDISLEDDDDFTDLSFRKYSNLLDHFMSGNFLFGSNDFYDDEPRVKRQASYKPQGSRAWKIQLVYVAQGDDDDDGDTDEKEKNNIFTEERLQQIHDIEMSIMQHPDFKDFCYKSYAHTDQDPNLSMFDGCAPLNSLLTYFYPSLDKYDRVHYDGLGSKLEDVDKTLKFAMTRDTFYWYVDDKINSTYRKSHFLRTEIQFGGPLKGYDSLKNDRRDEQNAKYKEVMKSYLKLFEAAATDKVKVLYGGNEVFDYEVDQIFWSDIRMAFFSLGFIALFMFILTSFSIWLTFWGIVAIVSSFPLAFFFYRYVFGIAKLGILNGAAVFVIIGIGVDDVFVFINTFRQASHFCNHGDRLAHTFTTAGLATFFTSFTTAAAFAANTGSSIPAVKEFGLFMSLIVSSCWITVVLLMPAVINLWMRARFALCEHQCFGGCSCCPSAPAISLPTDIQDFLNHTEPEEEGGVMMSDATSSTDNDVPMLGLEEVEEANGGWPVYLGMLKQAVDRSSNVQPNDDPLLQLEATLTEQEKQEGCGLTRMLQAAMYYYIARPIIKARWIVFLLFFILLGISGYLMSQLRPSQQQPQLFSAKTNLQQLADLAANFSDSGILCNECSAFYTERLVDPSVLTRPTRLTTLPALTTTPTTTTTTTTTLKPTSESTPTEETTTKPPSTTTTTKADVLSTIIPQSPSSASGESTTATTKTTTEGNGIIDDKTTTTAKTTTTTRPVATSSAKSIASTTKSTPEKTTAKGTTTKPTTTTSTTTTSPTTTPTTKKPKRTKPPTDKPKTPGPPKPPVNTPSPVNPPTAAPGTSPPSPTNYDPCAFGKCDELKERPNMELGAAVYVVFGIKGIDRSNVSASHVLEEKGSVVYDDNFASNFTLPLPDLDALKRLCWMCHRIANNTELVKPNGSQCLPSYMPEPLTSYLSTIEECKNLPANQYINGRKLPSRAQAGLLDDKLLWIAFAFESTTFKGQSYFDAYNDYQKWEAFIEELRTHAISPDSPLASMYQTSEFWTRVMMEVVAVTSAVYGLVFSLIICVAAVAIFTGHFLLLAIVVLTIIGAISTVVGIFYVAGWELGAIEAVSLSILVGTSVDYCMHLVEGYILAGSNPPKSLRHKPAELRQWRTGAAISHIGVSIMSSAVTTIIASIPLTMTVIRPFSKFGEIVAINTAASIVFTLTVCTAFLAIFAPAKYRISCKSVGIASAVTVVIVVIIVMSLYGAAKNGKNIPGPNGENLF